MPCSSEILLPQLLLLVGLAPVLVDLNTGDDLLPEDCASNNSINDYVFDASIDENIPAHIASG